MSEIFGNIDYQRVKRHYDYDDYAAIDFQAIGGVEVVYVPGTNALNPLGLPWVLPPPPITSMAILAAQLAQGLNVTAVADSTVAQPLGTLPAPPLTPVPPGFNYGMFEAKYVVLIPTVDCLVRFEPNYALPVPVAPGVPTSTRVQHFIQVAFAPFTIPRRFTALHVIGAVGAGTLYVHILG